MVKSISVSKAVQDLIDKDPQLQDALQRGYANHSSIARLLQPKVMETVGRKVNLVGVISSIRRARIVKKSASSGISNVISGSILSIRTDVGKFSVVKTTKTQKVLHRVLDTFWGDFLQVLIGVSVITIILDQRIISEVCSNFSAEEILDRKEGLAALIVQSPIEIISTPGSITAFYNQFSRRNINIEETVSCFTDTIIVLSMEDVGKALIFLTELISDTRKAMKKPVKASPRTELTRS